MKFLPIPLTIPISATRIATDAAGFEQLARLHASLCAQTEAQVFVDMAALRWFDAHLAAPLMVIVRQAQRGGNSIHFIGLNESVRAILQKNGFLAIKALDIHNTTMPMREFSVDQEVDFSVYVKKNLDRPQMPNMTKSLREKFFEGIDELFANAALHSKTPTRVTVGGQFYPNSRRLNFAIADGGRGIQGAIRDALHINMSAENAIEWAMTPKNTTRQGDIPGGLGLQIVRDFIQVNGGRMVIVSNDGIWSQSGVRVGKKRLPLAYPGTVVVLEIDTSDRRSYDLRAPKPQDIW